MHQGRAAKAWRRRHLCARLGRRQHACERSRVPRVRRKLRCEVPESVGQEAALPTATKAIGAVSDWWTEEVRLARLRSRRRQGHELIALRLHFGR